MSDNVDFGDFNWLSGGTPSVEDFDWTDYFSQQNATPLPAGDSSEFLNALPGYYDETSGKWVIDFASGTTPGDIAAGPNERWKDWKYDASKQTWTDPLGKNYDLSYLKSGKGAWDLIKSFGSKAADAATSKTGMAGILALLSYLDRQKGTSYGGGTTEAYAGPSRQLTPTTVQGKYGPLVQYAANGGLMQAYANGGKVWPFPMQDNGFVMTAKAVKGAEKLAAGGITSLLPDATMVRGRGTGTSDEVPAYIQGENGRTPARLSNGEAYIPPGYDTDELYALMHQLERNA